MPASSRSRFWLGIKVLGWALGVGASIATFGFLLGWRPVLIVLGIGLVLAAAFFSAYLHRRAWIVLDQQLRRAQQAEVELNTAKKQHEAVVAAISESIERFHDKMMKSVEESTAQRKAEWRDLEEAWAKVSRTVETIKGVVEQLRRQ